MFKRLLVLLTILSAVPSLAAGRAPAKATVKSAPAASAGAPTESSMNNNVGVTLAFPNSIAIGVDYEHKMENALGVGGYFKFIGKQDSGTTHPGIMAIGVQGAAHYDSGPFDLYIAPGFGIIVIDAVGSGQDKTTVGPRLATGVLYQITPMIAAGFEHSFYYAWFDKDVGGLVASDLALKARFTF
jgi:hypothetical protein